jgi:glucose/arabinose dehydrogenase
MYFPKNDMIFRLAGNGKKGSAGLSGFATNAELSRPHAVAVAADGTIYVADSENNRILKIVQ